jgi:formamidopyrimidine-DNA glycosylase
LKENRRKIAQNRRFATATTFSPSIFDSHRGSAHNGGVPELPEVQALVTDLGGRLVGRDIETLQLLSFAALKTFDPPASELHGRTITGVTRHGKFLDLEVGDDLHLIIGFALGGWVNWRAERPKPLTRPGRGVVAAHLVLAGGDGLAITEWGTKKGLSIWVVRAPSDVPRIATLGPDPFDLSFERFAAILAGAGRSQIKGVLRDQTVIAGIGNAYSDEILHAAKMSPFKPATMPTDDAHRLFDAMRETLQAALDRADGLAASELKAEKKSNLRVHGRTGLPCPVCGDTVRQVIFADSTFQYCPTCQTGGKPLADRVLSRLLK